MAEDNVVFGYTGWARLARFDFFALLEIATNVKNFYELT